MNRNNGEKMAANGDFPPLGVDIGSSVSQAIGQFLSKGKENTKNKCSPGGKGKVNQRLKKLRKRRVKSGKQLDPGTPYQ